MSTLLTRRSILAGGALIAANFAIGGAATALDGGGPAPLRPPSAQDERSFRATCLKCDRCRSACPQGILRPGKLEEGILNYRTPIIDFHEGFCDFCGLCADVCPTTAISRTDPDQDCIGFAEVDQERCIAWSAGGCRKCADACPYGAISLDSSGRPVVNAEECNGCGACEYVCPSNTFLSFDGGTSRGVNVCRTESA